MQKDDLIRLRHMLDAMKESLSFAEGKTRVDLNTNRMLVLSLVKDIEIIGEAATQLTEICRNELQQIPWKKIIGMRNRLIHAYFEINLDVLWKIVTEDLPPLVKELEKIILPEQKGEDHH